MKSNKETLNQKDVMKEFEQSMLSEMYRVADRLLKTSPEVNKMLSSCVTEEERNMKLAMAVIRVMSKN